MQGTMDPTHCLYVNSFLGLLVSVAESKCFKCHNF